MEFVLAAVVLAVIVGFVVSRPLLAAEGQERLEDDRRAALEAAKEAKYRDIRDAELDYRMGKLSEGDWRVTDRELRAQAIEILRELDALEPDESATARSNGAGDLGETNGAGAGQSRDDAG